MKSVKSSSGSGKTSRRSGSSSGKTSARPGSSSGKTSARPGPSSGKTSARPGPSSGKTSARPGPSSGKTSGRSGSSSGKTSGRSGLSSGNKRGSDKTVNNNGNNGNSPDLKKGKTSNSDKKTQPRVHDVFIAKFQTGLPHSDAHRSLFVELTKDRGVSRGNVYEVIGPFDERMRTSTISKYKFHFGAQKAPENSEKCMGRPRQIGWITEDKLTQLLDVCNNVLPPRGPLHYSMTRNNSHPDCNDWLHNVIYQLKRQNVVQFLENFSPPRHEIVPLVWSTSGNLAQNMFSGGSA